MLAASTPFIVMTIIVFIIVVVAAMMPRVHLDRIVAIPDRTATIRRRRRPVVVRRSTRAHTDQC